MNEMAICEFPGTGNKGPPPPLLPRPGPPTQYPTSTGRSPASGHADRGLREAIIGHEGKPGITYWYSSGFRAKLIWCERVEVTKQDRQVGSRGQVDGSGVDGYSTRHAQAQYYKIWDAGHVSWARPGGQGDRTGNELHDG
jgi:hypothetical protein